MDHPPEQPVPPPVGPDHDAEDLAPWRQSLHTFIFEADTPTGKAFDVLLLVAILASTIAVMLETVESLAQEYGTLLTTVEWIFTVLFTIEYVLRLICVRRPGRYARSFFGVVDLVSFLPTYVSLIIPGAQTLLVVRLLRLLRIFRILKLARFLHGAAELRKAVYQAREKIVVFLFTVVTVVCVMGSAMYMIEHPYNDGFASIPQSMYWAIVTMTTVGYGDVTPVTVAGKLLASLIILIGYAL
ncbi:MAG: ion transporter, partial [Phycisphaeraceae bacterium]|nr:ion transporter [Phycisphaeraceae bacterium]